MTYPPAHDDSDTRLRFSIWIGGDLIDQQWIDSEDPGAGELAEEISDRHGDLADEAEAHGWPWLIEVYDPAAPPHEAYVRFGTDRDGMVSPVHVRDAPRHLQDLFLPGDQPGTLDAGTGT